MEKQKNIPKLRFPEFAGEWERKKLGEISDLITKGTTPNKFVNQGIKFIKIECFDGDKINSEKCLFIDEKTHNKELKRSILQENDLLFAIAGTIGKVNFVRKEILPANTNQALAIIRLKKDECKDYIYQILKSKRMHKYINDSISVGAQPNLNLEQMNNFSFFYPSLPEQTCIASFFTVIDKKISELKQKKNLLEQYKKGVMQKLFSQELRFKDENGKEFPKWEEKKLSSFMVERNIQEPKNEEYPLMAFVANKGVTHKGDRYNREFLVDDEENKKYKQTEFGDFIYSSNNLETGSIGLNNYGSASISPVYSIFEIKEMCNYQFISSFLTSKVFIGKMIRYRQGVVYGQWRIHETAFLQIKVKLPSLEEQTKIANFLSVIDKKIYNTQTQLEKTELYKKGLLQKMFC